MSDQHLIEARRTVAGLNGKQLEGLKYLFEGRDEAHSPSKIGVDLGKPYSQASSYALSVIRPLIKKGLAHRVDVGRGQYQITHAGWHAFYYGHLCSSTTGEDGQQEGNTAGDDGEGE